MRKSSPSRKKLSRQAKHDGSKKTPKRVTALRKPSMNLPAIQPSPREVLNYAFMNKASWIPFFNELNNLYENNLTKVIHDAKTIAVASAVLKLTERFSCEVRQLYQLTTSIFDYPSPYRLSCLIDLYSPESFSSTIEKVQRRYLTLRSEPQPSCGTQAISGIGTLPLFGMETYVFKKKARRLFRLDSQINSTQL